MKTTDLPKPPGTLFILSGPSGVGKTTLRRRLQRKIPTLQFSVSWTTRSPRPGEQADRDYHFVSAAAFREQIDRGGFLEWARVHDDYYGTPRQPVETWLHSGEDVLLDIDVQGAEQIKQKIPEAVTVFILPPSGEELEKRLSRRKTEAAEVRKRRLANAEKELAAWSRFDFAVVNRELREALADLEAIIRAQRHRVRRGRLNFSGVLE
jgi:guanylate kinase